MARVTGIGGVFFKARDPEALRAWYQRHLGFDIQPWGGLSFPCDRPGGVTVWSVSPDTPEAFAPSRAASSRGPSPASISARIFALRRRLPWRPR